MHSGGFLLQLLFCTDHQVSCAKCKVILHDKKFFARFICRCCFLTSPKQGLDSPGTLRYQQAWCLGPPMTLETDIEGYYSRALPFKNSFKNFLRVLERTLLCWMVTIFFVSLCVYRDIVTKYLLLNNRHAHFS